MEISEKGHEIMKEQNMINDRINNLNSKLDIKQYLARLNTICSKPDVQRNIIPNLCLVGESGSGIRSISQIYADIILENEVLEERCGKEMLKLNLSTDMDNRSLMLLSWKIKMSSGLRNIYYGICLIQIDGENEDIKEEHIIWLLKLIERNKINMRFVIHISKSIKNYLILLQALEQNSLVKIFHTEFPNTNEAMNYTISELEKNNIMLDMRAKEKLQCIVEQLTKKTYYKGFKTMNHMVSKMVLECMMRGYRNPLTQGKMKSMEDILILEDTQKQNKIGF